MHRFFAFIAACVALLAGLLLMEPRASAIEFEQATSDEPIVVRLIHPIGRPPRCFACLRDVPRHTPQRRRGLEAVKSRDPNQLGKPLEAVISFFNPEMVREWSVFHEARFQLGFDPETGSGRWRLTVPGDDGTLARLITALRLSGKQRGTGRERHDRRQPSGRPDAAVAARSGGGVVLQARGPSSIGVCRRVSRARLFTWRQWDSKSARGCRPQTPIRVWCSGSNPCCMTLPARGSVATRRGVIQLCCAGWDAERSSAAWGSLTIRSAWTSRPSSIRLGHSRRAVPGISRSTRSG